MARLGGAFTGSVKAGRSG
jgi:hypothetical protein